MTPRFAAAASKPKMATDFLPAILYFRTLLANLAQSTNLDRNAFRRHTGL
jgi:hypothetical protein